ncbi:MAG: sel1 repeat family protein [Candidatus Melainabacteria bacterium]|nr:MAG: sel1 repeat family protein [Candidatus Melainabacteria bacterium]
MFRSNGGMRAKEQQMRKTLSATRISALKHHILEKALTSSDPAMHYQAGLLYVTPESKNYEKATIWFSQAAKGGDPHAQLYLAQIQIATGDATAHKQAHELLLQAAAQGLAEAENDLGVMYELGVGVERNLKEAFQWYQRAASNGIAQSQYNLALMYLDVDYPIHDIFLGIYWLRVAANQGHNKSLRTLAQMYERGDNVVQDVLKSERLYIAAAKNADAYEKLQLAIRYCRGSGVPLDRRKAAKWLESAANQGDGQISDLAMLCLLENRNKGKLKPIRSTNKPAAKVRHSASPVQNRSKYYV